VPHRFDVIGGRKSWRRRVLGVSTLFGRPQGFFIPYRYAASIRPPDSYKSLEPLFAAAVPEFRRRLACMADYLPAFMAMRGPSPTPRFDQDWFPRLDAAASYAAVRDARPGRIIEVGSGHSTRFMARAIADGDLPTRLLAIDPAPRASLNDLPIEWVRSTVQDVDAAALPKLAPGDILFIDSSHILMPGSDVDWLLNRVLPELPTGVIVHIHDIFLPDPYPEAWSWRGYNEQNAVLALLLGARWRLVWSSRWMATRMAADIARSGLDGLPLLDGAYESSLWLEKI
jgi:hypothetical protein